MPVLDRERMKQYRNHLGLTQATLGDLVDCEEKYIGRIERGERSPDANLAVRIDAALRQKWNENETVSTAMGEYKTILFFDPGKHEESRDRIDSLLHYDPREDGLYMINRWSPARLLTKERLSIEVSSIRPKQTWFKKKQWDDAVAAAKAKKLAGDVCYLIDYLTIDHRESQFGEHFRMTITPCDYSEHIATKDLLARNPNVRARIGELMEEDTREYARKSLPSSIAINVVVLSTKNNFLAVKRSSAVQDAKNLWTVGPYETMTLKPDTPAKRKDLLKIEDFFELAERCIREEVGLEPNQYGEVVISWFGYYLPLARGHIVAQTRLSVSEDEALDCASSSHSVFEAERWEWIPFNRESISQYVANRKGPLADKNWLDQSRLSFCEAWRMRQVLSLK